MVLVLATVRSNFLIPQVWKFCCCYSWLLNYPAAGRCAASLLFLSWLMCLWHSTWKVLLEVVGIPSCLEGAGGGEQLQLQGDEEEWR